MNDPTNSDRADWAEAAISAHTANDQCTDEEAMRDLLCNLRHLAKRQNLDIEAFWLGSKSVFAEEVAEETELT